MSFSAHFSLTVYSTTNFHTQTPLASTASEALDCTTPDKGCKLSRMLKHTSKATTCSLLISQSATLVYSLSVAFYLCWCHSPFVRETSHFSVECFCRFSSVKIPDAPLTVILQHAHVRVSNYSHIRLLCKK